MKKQLGFLSALLIMGAMLFVGESSKKTSQAYYDYKSQVIGTELDGSYTIRAWGRARNKMDAYEQARKTAVYDVIFNGVESANSTIDPLKPLLLEVNAKEKYEDYFNKFFRDNGDFEKYVSIKEKRIGSTKYKKTDTQTMAQVTLCVYRSELKAKLIEDGILKTK